MAKRISELDVATSVSDADYIPCVQGGVTKRATRAALYPDDVPVDTSSRILDLTGDRAPAIPDDPAGVTYLSNFATLDGWTGVNASVSVSGEKLIATCANLVSDFGMDKNIAATGNIIIIKARASKSGTLSTLINWGSTSEVSLEAGVWKTVGRFYSGTTSVFSVRKSLDVSIGDTLEIDWVYVGTGAYLSKLVDRAGVPWTNYGALPVDGPFGRGLGFYGNSYLQAPGPMIGDVWTVALDLSPSSLAANNQIFTNQTTSLTTGYRFFINPDGDLVGRIHDGTTQEVTSSSLGFMVNSRKRVVITCSGSEIKVYSESVLINTTAITISGLSSTPFFVGTDNQVTKQFFKGTIYAFRADSRVWTDDEIARWSRDPYSEDSGLVDAFSLSFANLPTFADNAAAIAGKLPAGKLYKTSTGNVLVRY